MNLTYSQYSDGPTDLDFWSLGESDKIQYLEFLADCFYVCNERKEWFKTAKIW